MAIQHLTISDFSGGRNSLDSQLFIQDNQCTTATRNVWAPSGALEKGPGYSEYKSMTATANKALTIRSEVIKNTGYLFCVMTSAALGSAYFWDVAPGDATPLGYVTGTVSISGASLISATGSGTTWSSHVSADDKFRANSSAAEWRIISSVEDNTHLTLQDAMPVAVATGSAYTILKKLNPVPDIAMASLNSQLIIFDGIHITQTFDTTGVSNISAAPQAYFAVTHKSYVFTLRTDTNESRLRWSAFNDPTSWPTNNFIDIDKNRGKGTGLISYGNELIILKTYGMFKIVGEIFDPSNPTYSVYPISVPVSFVSNSGYLPTIHKGMLFIYSYEGLYVYIHGTNSAQKFKNEIDPDFLVGLNNTGDPALITANSSRMRAISYKDFLFILFTTDNSGQVTSDTIGILDQKGGWWVSHLQGAAGTGAFLKELVLLPGAAPKLLGIDRTGARLLDLDVEPPTYTKNFIIPTTGNSTGIDSLWTSKEFNIGYGTFKWATIYFEKQTAGNLTFKYSIDQGAFTSETISMTSGRGTTIRFPININQKGSTIQIQLAHNTSGQTFKVYRIDIFYEQDLMARVI